MKGEANSLFNHYSIGIVVEDKKPGSNQIKVYPVEHFPYVEGLIKDHKLQYDFSLPNLKGIDQKMQLKGDVILVADWLPADSNRQTAPDVVANETVDIYRYSDTDKYYWKTSRREPLLRRLETVCHAYGNLREPGKAFDKESSYWFEVSTHQKTVTFSTSKSDGEKYKYTVMIDSKNHTVIVRDDVGNSFILNSQEGSVALNAVKKIEMNVEKTGITITDSKIILSGDVEVKGSFKSGAQNVDGKVEAIGGFSQGGTQLNVP